jgi:hypothetical protein
VAGADLARVDLVVAEVGIRHGAVLVAEQAVAVDLGRVELDLQLDVARHGLDRAHEVVHEHLFGLLARVDVVAHAVALVGQLLEQHVVVVVHAHADRVQVHALLADLLDGLRDHVGIGHADVGDAVGEEHDAVRGFAVQPASAAL